MFHLKRPTGDTAEKLRWIAVPTAIFSSLAAGLWLFVHAPARIPDQHDPQCLKFKKMLDYSSDTAWKIFGRFDKEATDYDENKVPNEADYNDWAITMQRHAAEITGKSDLARHAVVLSNDARQVYALFLAARSDRSPTVEQSHLGWMSDYNRISHDFDNAAAAFAFDCPGMKLVT
jgi:hypothetical protein